MEIHGKFVIICGEKIKKAALRGAMLLGEVSRDDRVRTDDLRNVTAAL